MQNFLSAHEALMKDLINENGKWRSRGVGIFKGTEVAHVAPPAKQISHLIRNLFEFLKEEQETPWLLKACIFHYELEFIHPFLDGNGRMGRLWQQLLLTKESPIFKFITVEELIKANQEDYYTVLNQCDREGNSTLFIEFSLNLILLALENYRESTSRTIKDPKTRLHYARRILNERWFSRKDYMNVHKDISPATASRDLHFGVIHGILTKKGTRNQHKYHYAS